MEKRLKIKTMFQGILDPVLPQAKKAFVNSLSPINQSCFV